MNAQERAGELIGITGGEPQHQRDRMLDGSVPPLGIERPEPLLHVRRLLGHLRRVVDVGVHRRAHCAGVKGEDRDAIARSLER
jgi:hypothetical protein